MSLYSVMRTSISGMSAQAEKISITSDNIANSSTVGYKRSTTSFAQIVANGISAGYVSGGVDSGVVTHASEPGAIQEGSSTSNLAIAGDGFFMVRDSNGRNLLTRAGSFNVNGSGQLVNAAGQLLLGTDVWSDGVQLTPGDLAPVSALPSRASPSATTVMQLSVNLPEGAQIVPAADLPSANSANPQFSGKTTMSLFGSLGQSERVDVYFAKSAENKWECSVYLAADGGSDGFPYSSGPLLTSEIEFDPMTGNLTAPFDGSLAIGDSQVVEVELGGTQFSSPFQVAETSSDGRPAIAPESFEVDASGELYYKFSNGSRVHAYSIPIATVPGPDFLRPAGGTAFEPTGLAGPMALSRPGTSGAGSILAGQIEQANVDLAAELTDMVTAQRDYTANSRVFQTGMELLDVVVNLKR